MKYKLVIKIEIQKIEDDGRWTNERFSVDETIELKPTDFMKAVSLLGRFHTLSEEIGAEEKHTA